MPFSLSGYSLTFDQISALLSACFFGHDVSLFVCFPLHLESLLWEAPTMVWSCECQKCCVGGSITCWLPRRGKLRHRDRHLSRITDSFFEEKALIFSPKLWQEDGRVKYRNSSVLPSPWGRGGAQQPFPACRSGYCQSQGSEAYSPPWTLPSNKYALKLSCLFLHIC